MRRSPSLPAFVATTILGCGLRAQIALDGLPAEQIGQTLLVQDLDGDGRADIVAGAPSHGTGDRHRVGRYVAFRTGRDGFKDWRTASWAGHQSGSFFASALAAGDLDGNGAPDLVVGAPGAEKAKGSVHFFRGAKGGGEIFGGGDLAVAASSLRINGVSELGGFGTAVAIGDFDADGRPELAVSETGAASGEAQHAGRVLVFRGRKEWKGPLGVAGEGDFKPELVISGRAEEGLGRKILFTDLDGDKFDDLVVSSISPQHGNVVYVFPGRRDLVKGLEIDLAKDEPAWTVRGLAGGGLGEAMAAIDLDGDGRKELLLSEPKAGKGAGAVHLVKLKPEATEIDLRPAVESGVPALRGQVANEALGTAFALVSGFGGDRPDLISGAAHIGRVALFADLAVSDGAPEPLKAFRPAMGVKGLGAAVGAGDIDGDGKPEVVVSAPAGNKLFVFPGGG